MWLLRQNDRIIPYDVAWTRLLEYCFPRTFYNLCKGCLGMLGKRSVPTYVYFTGWRKARVFYIADIAIV